VLPALTGYWSWARTGIVGHPWSETPSIRVTLAFYPDCTFTEFVGDLPVAGGPGGGRGGLDKVALDHDFHPRCADGEARVAAFETDEDWARRAPEQDNPNRQVTM
jgi:hypothetical protein